MPTSTGRSCEPLREDELVAGDNVKIELEWEVLKMMQEKHGGWNEVMMNVSQSYIKKKHFKIYLHWKKIDIFRYCYSSTYTMN